jgi:hypothetical protein
MPFVLDTDEEEEDWTRELEEEDCMRELEEDLLLLDVRLLFPLLPFELLALVYT